MGDDVPDWLYMWGAQVKSPVDMPDDMLKDAIHVVGAELDAMKAANKSIEEDGLAICERVKHHFDKTWSPYWHVIIGNNFGSFCTHEMRGYIYFYYGSFVRLPPRGLSLSRARRALRPPESDAAFSSPHRRS